MCIRDRLICIASGWLQSTQSSPSCPVWNFEIVSEDLQTKTAYCILTPDQLHFIQLIQNMPLMVSFTLWFFLYRYQNCAPLLTAAWRTGNVCFPDQLAGSRPVDLRLIYSSLARPLTSLSLWSSSSREPIDRQPIGTRTHAQDVLHLDNCPVATVAQLITGFRPSKTLMSFI